MVPNPRVPTVQRPQGRAGFFCEVGALGIGTGFVLSFELHFCVLGFRVSWFLHALEFLLLIRFADAGARTRVLETTQERAVREISADNAWILVNPAHVKFPFLLGGL